MKSKGHKGRWGKYVMKMKEGRERRRRTAKHDETPRMLLSLHNAAHTILIILVF